MSMELMQKVWKHKINDNNAKMILLKLADYADEDGICYASTKRLSEECEMSRRTVFRHIKKLEEKGVIARVPRFFQDGRQGRNDYHILI